MRVRMMLIRRPISVGSIRTVSAARSRSASRIAVSEGSRASAHDPAGMRPDGQEGDIKLVTPLTLENIADSSIAEGPATREEIDSVLDELYGLAVDGMTVLALPFTAVSRPQGAGTGVYCLTWDPAQVARDPVIAVFDWGLSSSGVRDANFSVLPDGGAQCPTGVLEVQTLDATDTTAPLPPSDGIEFNVLVP
jgi:hypothetical protein